MDIDIKLDSDHETTVNFTMPVFNRYLATQKALLELRKTDTNIDYTITVVDNGSDENLVKKLKEFHKIGIIDKLFLLDRNMGIACACNIGWEMTSAKYYCKIDNDTMPIKKDWMSSIFKLWENGERFSNIGYAENHEVICKNKNFKNINGEILGICDKTLPGTGIFIPEVVSDIVGYWNEEYGLYGAEDGDYGIRMKYLDFKQYYYLKDNYIRFDLDKLDDACYIEHGLNKKEQIDAYKKNKNGYFGRFGLNSYLFNYNIRSPKVCRKYDIYDVDDFKVHLKENKRFKDVDIALEKCSDLLMHSHVDNGEFGLYDPDLIEKMKKILKACDEDTETFNKNLEKNFSNPTS